jgi:hypothetical protein
MIVVKAGGQRAAAVPGGAKSDLLGRLTWFGVQSIVGGDETGNIGKIFDGGGLAGERVKAHEDSSSMFIDIRLQETWQS